MLSLRLEIAEFRCILSQVRDVAISIEGSNSSISDALENVKPLIYSGGQDLQELDELVEYQLKKCDDRDKKGRLKVSRDTWLRKQEKLKQLRQRVRTRLLGFDTALSAAQLYVLAR